jgi:hypothetical protein
MDLPSLSEILPEIRLVRDVGRAICPCPLGSHSRLVAATGLATLVIRREGIFREQLLKGINSQANRRPVPDQWQQGDMNRDWRS